MKVKITISCIVDIGDDTPEYVKQALEDGEITMEEIGATDCVTTVKPVE